MGLFDGLQRAAQKVVTTVFGDVATWAPLAGGSYTAAVLLNVPTDQEEVGDQKYIAVRPRMEYLVGNFPGLLESVLDKQGEIVTVNGQQYVGMWGEKKFDGTTIIIHLEPVS